MKVTKVLAVFAAIALSAVTTHAKVGTHNGFITLNGGFNYGKGTVSQYSVDNAHGLFKKGSFQDQLGGAVGFDIGYQYYSPTKLIHGVDAVIGMNAGFERFKGSKGFDGTDKYVKAKGEDKKTGFPTLVGYVSSTYALGFHAANTRFMFDVLGLQLAFGQISSRQAIENATTHQPTGKFENKKFDTIFNVGLNLPLGFRAVMDNGFIIGFRHTLAFNGAYKGVKKDGVFQSFLGDEKGNRFFNLMQYSMMFSIGFAFGK